MIIDFDKVSFYVKPGSTDLRKQINGLSILVQEDMEQDPFSGSLFLFCNRQRKLLKIIYWDKNGFWLFSKRLEQDKFPWPDTKEEAKQISFEECKLLLQGIDFWKAHKPLSFSKVS
jgi:transposase